MPKNSENTLDRVANLTKSYEGGGIPPLPQGGRRISTISNLKVAKQENQVDGAKFILTWFDENEAEQDNYKIMIYSGDNLLTWNGQNLRDVNFSKLQLYQTPIEVKQSPATIFVESPTRRPIIITVRTRHSSGLLSLEDFQSSVSAIIDPKSTYFKRITSNITLDANKEYMVLADATGGNITVTLPPVSMINDGFLHQSKKMDASANTVTIQGNVAAETIDGAASVVISTQYGSLKMAAERSTKVWWLVK